MFRYPSNTPNRVQIFGNYGTPANSPFQTTNTNPFVQGSTSTMPNVANRMDNNNAISILKPPKPPDRPLVPYMRFSRKMWAKVRADKPELQLWDIGKVIGHMWRESSEIDKSIYQEEYDLEKIDYDKALKLYHNSAAYQAYLTAKNRAKVLEKTATINVPMQRSTISTNVVSNPVENAGVLIEPVDEDQGEGQVSMRKVAAIRFDRNHRLISELFSSNVVTDTRTIVSQQRIDMLRKQAQSLAMHQTKLEDELRRLEENFQSKKRTIEDAGQTFADHLKRVCEERPNINEILYEEMVEKAVIKLKHAYEEHKKQQEIQRVRQESERQQLVDQTPILYQLTTSDAIPTNTRIGSQLDNENDEKVDENRQVGSVEMARDG